MRRALLFVATMLFLTCTSAFADGSGVVNFTGSATPLVGAPFTFSFSEPGTLSSLTTTTTVSLSTGSNNLVLPGAEVDFYGLGDKGLFDIDFDYGGNNYLIELFGLQSFSGTDAPYSLLTGNFKVTGGVIYINYNPYFPNPILKGKVTATATAPEPAGLAMLALGLAAVAGLRKRKLVATP